MSAPIIFKNTELIIVSIVPLHILNFPVVSVSISSATVLQLLVYM